MQSFTTALTLRSLLPLMLCRLGFHLHLQKLWLLHLLITTDKVSYFLFTLDSWSIIRRQCSVFMQTAAFLASRSFRGVYMISVFSILNNNIRKIRSDEFSTLFFGIQFAWALDGINMVSANCSCNFTLFVVFIYRSNWQFWNVSILSIQRL